MKGIFSRPPILIAALVALSIAALFTTGCDGATVGTVAVTKPAPIKTVYKQTPTTPLKQTASVRQSDVREVIKCPVILSSIEAPIYRPTLGETSSTAPDFKPLRGPPLIDYQEAMVPMGFAGFDHSRARERV